MSQMSAFSEINVNHYDVIQQQQNRTRTSKTKIIIGISMVAILLVQSLWLIILQEELTDLSEKFEHAQEYQRNLSKDIIKNGFNDKFTLSKFIASFGYDKIGEYGHFLRDHP